LLFNQQSAKYISRYITQGNLEKARSVVSRVLQITLLVSLVSSMCLLIFSEQISWVLTSSNEWLALFRILAATCFFIILFPQVSGFLQGLQKMRELAFVNFIFTAVQYLSGILENVISQLYLFLIYVIVGAIVCFLSLLTLKAIKKQDLELTHEYLPGRFKRITVWVERLASIE